MLSRDNADGARWGKRALDLAVQIACEHGIPHGRGNVSPASTSVTKKGFPPVAS